MLKKELTVFFNGCLSSAAAAFSVSLIICCEHPCSGEPDASGKGGLMGGVRAHAMDRLWQVSTRQLRDDPY